MTHLARASMHFRNLRHLCLASREEAVVLLQGIGVDPYGIEAMLPKMFHLNVLLEGVNCKVANIIKQEMLSLGGDAAVARGTVACSIDQTDVLVMGTLKQLRGFAGKVAHQPFGLAEIAAEILSLVQNLSLANPSLRTARRELPIGQRTLIMGILNVTPDSFSDGGRWSETEGAVVAGRRMVDEGADLLDVGGESTRPGSDPVSVREEMRRVIPVIRELGARVNVPISVDTMKAEVARAALDVGAEIINDVSALRHDAGMASTVAASGAAVVLMHMRGTPKVMQDGDLSYGSLRGEILTFLQERIGYAIDQGIGRERIVLDPGIGFGKSPEDNLRLVKHLADFKGLGRPLLLGVSRKSFIGAVTGGSPSERDEGTAAAVTSGILSGCHMVRVHQVAMMKKVVAMADALVRA